MRRLIALGALLAVASPASAIGLGISGHYNLGIPLAPDGFKDFCATSYVGFQGDIEIAVHPFVNVVAAFGFQSFKSSEFDFVSNVELIPILFGVEYPAVFGKIAFFPGGGISYNVLNTNIQGIDDEKKAGIWLGGNFYYMFNPKIGIGAGVAYNMIFTEGGKRLGEGKMSWLHIPFGIKYWFM
jgi:hypothetical protein